MKLIKTTVLDAESATITISNIPQEFKTLKIVISARTANTTGRFDDLYLQPNSATTNLSNRAVYGTGSAAASNSESNVVAGFAVGNSATASTFGSAEVTIPNYSGSANKTVSVDTVSENNETLAIQYLSAGLWSSSAAITSIKLDHYRSGNFMVGTTVYIYGIG